MVEVWEPRYHDRTVLVAPWKLTKGKNIIRVMKGYYQGVYSLDYDEIAQCEKTTIKSKTGGDVEMYCVPISKLILNQEEDNE